MLPEGLLPVHGIVLTLSTAPTISIEVTVSHLKSIADN